MIAATPLWVPVFIAVLGIAGTIGGVLITQWRSDQREKTNWNRERERERERWAREDEARTFEHRREAYSDFYESLREMADFAFHHGLGSRADESWVEVQQPTYRNLQHLRLYATPSVTEAAVEAYDMTFLWLLTKFGEDDPNFDAWNDRFEAAEEELLTRIREDLSVPDS